MRQQMKGHTHRILSLRFTDFIGLQITVYLRKQIFKKIDDKEQTFGRKLES